MLYTPRMNTTTRNISANKALSFVRKLALLAPLGLLGCADKMGGDAGSSMEASATTDAADMSDRPSAPEDSATVAMDGTGTATDATMALTDTVRAEAGAQGFDGQIGIGDVPSDGDACPNPAAPGCFVGGPLAPPELA